MKRGVFMNLNLTELQYISLAKEMFTKTLSEIPLVSDVTTNDTVQRGFWDFKAVVYFSEYDTPQEFFIDVKSSGEKRFALRFTNQALQQNDDACYMLMAPYISDSTAELLRSNNLSYMDLCGNCYILTKRMVIRFEGKSNKYVEKREKKHYLSKSSSAASAIIRTMLDDPDRYWKVKDLSEKSGKGLGTVSNVKSFLRDKDWLDEHDKGFRLKNISELLHEWSRDYHKTDSLVKEYYSFDSIAETEKKISDWNMAHDNDAILGGFSAAARYAPVVRYNRVNVYVKEQSLYEFVKDNDLEPVQSGGNIIVTIPHDDTPCTFSKSVNNSLVTSPAQTIIDLLGMPNRGEEAALAIITKCYKGEKLL